MPVVHVENRGWDRGGVRTLLVLGRPRRVVGRREVEHVVQLLHRAVVRPPREMPMALARAPPFALPAERWALM